MGAWVSLCSSVCVCVCVAGGNGYDIAGLGSFEPVVVPFHQIKSGSTGIGVFSVCFLVLVFFFLSGFFG